VIEAAIIGVPCEVLGERVCAFVSLKSPVLDSVLTDWCLQRLSDYKVPEQWRTGAEPLPRNANGKVMKQALRKVL